MYLKGGGHEFDSCLLDAYRVCKNNMNNYDLIKIIYISDAKGSIPKYGMQKLIEDEILMGKI